MAIWIWCSKRWVRVSDTILTSFITFRNPLLCLTVPGIPLLENRQPIGGIPATLRRSHNIVCKTLLWTRYLPVSQLPATHAMHSFDETFHFVADWRRCPRNGSHWTVHWSSGDGALPTTRLCSSKVSNICWSTKSWSEWRRKHSNRPSRIWSETHTHNAATPYCLSRTNYLRCAPAARRRSCPPPISYSCKSIANRSCHRRVPPPPQQTIAKSIRGSSFCKATSMAPTPAAFRT